MLKKIKQKFKNKKGMATLEFVLCLLLLIAVTAFIIDLFFVSYKHYVVSANCTKAARVISIQGGLGNSCPNNYPGGNPNYMTNREFKNYLNELAETVQGDPGEFKVYIGYSYIDNYDNVIEKENLLVYHYKHDRNGTISKTYYPQDFLIPYGSFITLKFEYTYEFFYTNIWYGWTETPKFHSSKSYVTEYVSYDFSYHINGQSILTPIQDLPSIDTNVGEGQTAQEKYFLYHGTSITGLSDEGKAAHITDLIIPDRINGQPILQISENAFADCDTIVSVKIPSKIVHIGAGAFAGCDNLTTVKYYEGLERIDANAFAGCHNLKFFGPAYNYKDADEQSGATAPNRIIFPKSLLEVHSKAFEGCTSIQKVRIGSNLVKMAEDTFNGTGVYAITLEGSSGTVLGSPWKQVDDGTGKMIPDTGVTVSWSTKRTN